jgi:hypothetical protein
VHCYIAKSISGFVAVATTAARAGVSAAVALQRSYCHLWMSVHCQAYGRWIHITGFFCWLVSKKCIIWRYTRLVPLRDVWWQPFRFDCYLSFERVGRPISNIQCQAILQFDKRAIFVPFRVGFDPRETCYLVGLFRICSLRQK